MKDPTSRELRSSEIEVLVALVHDQLAPDKRRDIEARVESDEKLAQARTRLEGAQAALADISSAKLPEVPWRKIEAQVRWQLAQTPSRGPGNMRLRWTVVATAALLVGAIGGVLTDRALRRPVPSRPLVQLVPTPLLPAVVPDENSDEPLAALAMSLAGNVKVIPAGGSIARLRPNRPVLPGERVITGRRSRVALQWQARTGTLLSPNGELELTQLTRRVQELTLWKGEAFFEVKRTSARQRFWVNAHNLQVRVVGTQFGVRVHPTMSEVEVYEGKIAAFMRDPKTGETSGLPIIVEAGFRLRVLHGTPRSGRLLSRLPKRAQERARIHLGPWQNVQETLANSGLLDISTIPAGADLRFDSRDIGRTNLRVRGQRGRHLIELWRHGKLQKRFWIEVKALGELQVIRTRLRPKAAPITRLDSNIADQFRRHAPLIRACYERQLKRYPQLSGKLVLEIAIGDDGRVSNVGIARDTLGADGKAVGRCAQLVIRRWRFAPGSAASVVYPFVFRRR